MIQRTPSALASLHLESSRAICVKFIFRDPVSNTYIAIPYRDRTRLPVSRWEIQAAEKRLREAGYARVEAFVKSQII